MRPWRFLDYVLPDGAIPIRDWYANQDKKARAAFDFTMHQLKVTDDWIDPEIRQFSILKRDHAGLGELRFWTQDPTRDRKFRTAGLYRPTERDFILFTGCEKSLRGSIYDPPDAFDVALKYKQDFEAGKGTAIDHA